jgi:hypothetical protein
MSAEMITAWAAVGGVIFAALAICVTIYLYLRDQRQQRAAQTREDLQAIIGDCERFLHPLSEEEPYPILHTAAIIIKEFCSRLDESAKGKDVLALLHNKDLLLSICVEGWVSSTQIIRMMSIVEEVERKAASHNLRGKLLLICQASFLLAGIVAQVCSPTSFYNMLSQLEPESCQNDDVQDFLNRLTVELQNGICQTFNDNYKQTIKQCLYFIQQASGAFLQLEDQKLVHLAQKREVHHKIEANKKIEDPIREIEQETALPTRLKRVREVLDALRGDIDKQEYQILYELIELIKVAYVAL